MADRKTLKLPKRTSSATWNFAWRCMTCGGRASCPKPAPRCCGAPMVVPPKALAGSGGDDARAWLREVALEWAPADAATVAALASKCGAGRLEVGAEGVAAAATDAVVRMLRGAATGVAAPGKCSTAYVSRPWRAHASSMVSLAAFRKLLATTATCDAPPPSPPRSPPRRVADAEDGAAPAVGAPPPSPPPSALGAVVDALLRACTSDPEYAAEGWAPARTAETDVPELGLRSVHCAPDALYAGLPVELKTLSRLDGVTVDKLHDALQQTAVYQLPSRSVAVAEDGGGPVGVDAAVPALLVLVGREDRRVAVLVVSPEGNRGAAGAEWASWLAADADLPAIVALMNEYAAGEVTFQEVVARGAAFAPCCPKAACSAGDACTYPGCGYCHCGPVGGPEAGGRAGAPSPPRRPATPSPVAGVPRRHCGAGSASCGSGGSACGSDSDSDATLLTCCDRRRVCRFGVGCGYLQRGYCKDCHCGDGAAGAVARGLPCCGKLKPCPVGPAACKFGRKCYHCHCPRPPLPAGPPSSLRGGSRGRWADGSADPVMVLASIALAGTASRTTRLLLAEMLRSTR